MFDTPQKLNITLPHHWNACTAAQLEQIAAVMRDETERTTAFRPTTMLNVKTALFFLWSGLRIVEPINPRVKVEEQYYVCTHPSVDGEFNLYLWQIDYWTNGVPDYEREARMAKVGDTAAVPKKVKGLLDWLDDASDYGLTNMPYDTFCLRKQSDEGGVLSALVRPFMPRRRFRAPLPLMSDFSWQQYRIAHDLMDNYIKQMNALVRMESHRATHSPEQMHKQEQTVDLARAMFLACIFNRKVRYIDTDTRMAVYDYHYTSNQYSDNAQYFRHFPDDRWQVILFWWSGMMRYLQREYPHVFKVGKVKRNAPSNPLEVYTATIATLEKYLAQTEDELNRKTFTLTLETLERMAKENEEMERLRRK